MSKKYYITASQKFYDQLHIYHNFRTQNRLNRGEVLNKYLTESR